MPTQGCHEDSGTLHNVNCGFGAGWVWSLYWAVGQCGQFTVGSKIRHDWKTFHTERKQARYPGLFKIVFSTVTTVWK